ncbi:MAG: hypothetical protein ACK5B9_03500 [Flavobacteriia bacterium]|jgi:hypothetical protein
MKSLFLVIATFSASFYFAQDVRDIVRFSETQVYGSARFEAMAGSFGALGSDLSSAAVNPAGFGRYSSSAFGMTFQNTSILNKAFFNATETQTMSNNFKLNNLGFVFTNDVSQRNKGFIFQQIGFTYNRIQNFDNSYTYKGTQFKSLLDAYCDIAEGLFENELYSYLPFSSDLAYQTYAIDPNGSTSYLPRLGNTNMNHQRTVKNDGGISEFNINLSGNYMNKLYLGGNIGFRTTKFSEHTYHHEVALDNPDFSLDSFDYQFHLKTKGSGTNIKLGLIYLPTESLRLGLSFQSSTTYKMADDFSANMTSYHKDTIYRIAEDFVPIGKYNYKLKTAGKIVASAAYVFGTRGAINIDAEMVNHDRSKLRPDVSLDPNAYNFNEENEESRESLRTVINLRIGGELVFNSQYFIRGGFALYPSAYDPKINPTKGSQIFSGGIGFKWKKSALDLTLKVEHRNFNYYAFNESLTVVNSFRNGIVFNYSVNF